MGPSLVPQHGLGRARDCPTPLIPETGRNIKWSAELGTETHSTPVVAGGRVYIGTNNGHPRDPAQQGDRGVLMCFDEQTGRFLWQLVVPKRTEDIYYDWPNSGIASPVTVEGDRVYLVSNRGEVLCLEPATRKPRSPNANTPGQRSNRASSGGSTSPPAPASGRTTPPTAPSSFMAIIFT